jgi:AcrR family transcriptional regulator
MSPGEQASAPEPAWRRPARKAARRQPLSREAIVQATLRVLDAEGFERLSMRRVAAELGTGAGALYWHVAGKEELLTLVIDQVASELELPEPEPERWQEQLKELARELRSLMKRHRDVARISLGRIPLGPNTVRVIEWQLGLMRAAGIPDRTAALTGDLAALYVGAFAYEESLGLQSPDGRDRPPHEILAMIGDYFASLPADRFPNIVSLLPLLVAGDPDERFEFGLDVIVRGLAAQTEKAPPPSEGQAKPATSEA